MEKCALCSRMRQASAASTIPSTAGAKKASDPAFHVTILYKSMELKDKLPDMSEDEMLRLLATDGMLVKRPLLVGDDFVLVGFKETEWAEHLKNK